MSTIAAPAVEVKAVDHTRKNAISRARRVAWRHHLRIVSFRLSDGSYTYGFETKVPIVGPGNNSRALTIDELLSFCSTLAAKEEARRWEGRVAKQTNGRTSLR